MSSKHYGPPSSRRIAELEHELNVARAELAETVELLRGYDDNRHEILVGAISGKLYCKWCGDPWPCEIGQLREFLARVSP